MSLFEKHMQAPPRKPRRKWYDKWHYQRWRRHRAYKWQTQAVLTILYVVGHIDRNGVSWDKKFRWMKADEKGLRKQIKCKK